jgi:hypothetical protein
MAILCDMTQSSLTKPQALPRKTKYGKASGLIPFGDMVDQLIQPADYKYTINHCHEAQKFALYHQRASWAPPGFRWNQNGLGYCASDDTEVLTDRGWVGWPECHDGDLLGTVNPLTHQLEFQRPLARQVLEYHGDMVCSTNRRMDFSVTPNHRMYVRKWDESRRTLSDRYSFVEAGDLGWYCGLMHAPSGFLGTDLVEVAIPDDRAYDGDDFLAMLAMIVADGYAGGSESTRNWVSFCCFDPLHYDRVAALAHRVGFREMPSRRGVWTRYDAGALASWVRANCYNGGGLKSVDKHVPDLVKWTSERQIAHFLRSYLDQDRKSPLTMFHTSSRQIVDDLQELLLRIGKRSTPSWRIAQQSTVAGTGQRINSGPMCSLVVSQTDRLCLDKKKHIERDPYNGLVYCATMPNGTLVTRRNGSVLISGNCWTWSGTAALMDCMAREGKPVPLLSPVSMGWLVRWKNEGNYLESMIGGLKERGVCEMRFTPRMHTPDPKTFLEGWEDNALLYRLHEAYDADNSTKAKMIQHAISILNVGIGGYIAYNWWGHALELVALRWDETQANNLVWVIRNSHDEDDVIELTGNRGVPDELYGLRATKTRFGVGILPVEAQMAV